MEQKEHRFRKVLYLRQDYPDNYVDHTFLQDLERNVNVKYASLPSLLLQTMPITQQIAATFIFVSIFVKLYSRELSTNALLVFDGVVCSVSYLLSTLLSSSNSTVKAIEIPPVPLFVLYLLSPTLKTLTKATTSDSIWALSGSLLTVSLLLGDYRTVSVAYSSSPPLSVPNSTTDQHQPQEPASKTATTLAPPTISLTAALAGSTVLASRLESNEAVFSLLLFASIWFGPFPTWRSSWSLRSNAVATLSLVLGALVVTPREGKAWAGLLLVGSAVGAPLLRGALMIRLKDRIRGPWDQVVPVIGGATGA